MTIPLNATFSASKDQVSTVTGNEVVILGLADGIYYGLNDVGKNVWDMLKEPTTVQKICNKIADLYDTDAGTCQADVIKLLSDLYEHHLIQVEDAGIAKS